MLRDAYKLELSNCSLGRSRALQAVPGARNCYRQVPFNHGNSVEDSFLLLAMPDFVLANSD